SATSGSSSRDGPRASPPACRSEPRAAGPAAPAYPRRMSEKPAPMPQAAREEPDGSDLGRARGTDFLGLDELLTGEELELRDGVRRWCDEEVVPRAAGWWEEGRFPHEVLPGYAATRVAGASIQGYGCAGVSPLAEGMMCAELARGD